MDKEEMTIQKFMNENSLKDSELKLDDCIPWYRVGKKNWNFRIEGIDFRIDPLGNIKPVRINVPVG